MADVVESMNRVKRVRNAIVRLVGGVVFLVGAGLLWTWWFSSARAIPHIVLAALLLLFGVRALLSPSKLFEYSESSISHD